MTAENTVEAEHALTSAGLPARCLFQGAAAWRDFPLVFYPA